MSNSPSIDVVGRRGKRLGRAAQLTDWFSSARCLLVADAEGVDFALWWL